MNVDGSFFIFWVVSQAAFGLLFAVWPHVVIRLWALLSRQMLARGANDPFLDSFQSSPPGKLARRLTGTTARELMENPDASPALVWFMRAMGILGLAMVSLAVIVAGIVRELT